MQGEQGRECAELAVSPRSRQNWQAHPAPPTPCRFTNEDGAAEVLRGAIVFHLETIR